MPKRSLVPILLLSLTPTSAAGQGFPEKYTVEPGFDRPGADYHSFEQTSDFQSHELCRDACFSQPKCKSYTYVKPGVAGANAFCRLKDSEPAPVEDACCISAVKGGKPKRPAVASLQLQWLGWDQDKIGKDRNPDPDGAPDHRFVLEVRLAAPQEIVAVALRTSNDQGIPNDDLRWSSQGTDALQLAVESEGHRLSSPSGTSLGRHSGTVRLDLYAHDIGQWDTGRVVLAEVLLGDGRRLAHWAGLRPPPDRLLGIWQMHCSNNAPDAFEPITVSGRLQFTLLEDGTVRGSFGALPLTGRIAKGSAISGNAGDGKEAVEWRGELESAGRGESLRGRGTFRFVKATAGCQGEGVWSGGS